MLRAARLAHGLKWPRMCSVRKPSYRRLRHTMQASGSVEHIRIHISTTIARRARAGRPHSVGGAPAAANEPVLARAAAAPRVRFGDLPIAVASSAPDEWTRIDCWPASRRPGRTGMNPLAVMTAWEWRVDTPSQQYSWTSRRKQIPSERTSTNKLKTHHCRYTATPRRARVGVAAHLPLPLARVGEPVLHRPLAQPR